MKNNILITGGAGFIGSNLANFLVTRGYAVRVLDNLSPQIHGVDPESSSLFRSIKDRVEFIHGSVLDSELLEASLQGISTVVHLAAETGTGQSMYAIKHYTDVNIGGTSLLLDIIASKNMPIKKVIVASSRSIYGEGKYNCNEHGVVYPYSRSIDRMKAGDFEVHCPLCDSVVTSVPTDEVSMLNPASIYGITKLNQEQMVLTAARALGFSALAFRYQNVYGPGQSLSNPYTGILSIFSTRIRAGSSINIFEDGLESRDFVYIDDVVRATFSGIEYEPPIVEAFNVGSGKATTVEAIATALQRHLALKVKVNISGQFRVGDIRHNVADLSKISKFLKYVPSIHFDEGVHNFVSWVKGESQTEDLYEKSIKELKDKGLFHAPSIAMDQSVPS